MLFRSNGGNPANRQHYRSKSVLPSSKLGIEMMRANSHDSVNVGGGSDGTSTLEPITQVLTPNRDFRMEFPKFTTTPEPLPSTQEAIDEEDDEAETTVIHIETPPDRSFDEDFTMDDVEETPRPNHFTGSPSLEDDAPTPRPLTRRLDLGGTETPR